MRYEWLLIGLIASLPAVAQDWGRYKQGHASLAEIQVIRMPEIRHTPTYVSPHVAKHPNAHVTAGAIFQPPPGVGERRK